MRQGQRGRAHTVQETQWQSKTTWQQMCERLDLDTDTDAGIPPPLWLTGIHSVYGYTRARN